VTRKSTRRSTIFTLAMLASGAAAAQDAAATPAAEQPKTEQPAQPARPQRRQQQQQAPQTEFVEEMVVTGSRLPRAELTSAAPITVVTRQQLEATGRATIGEILQQLPEQSNAINTQVNNGGDGSTRIDLRGLGSARTLVLLNGRRHVAGGTGANASVDLNTIPVSAIQRIEVLKDGGSAIYGSDAISGVVNIILRKDFAGTETSLLSGISQRGDSSVLDMTFTTGQVTDRGNIMFSATFYNQGESWAGDREFSKYDQEYDWTQRRIRTLGSSSIPQGYIGTSGTGGNDAWQRLVTQYGNNGPFINDNGTWRQYNTIGVRDAGGDQYNYQPENYLQTPQQRAHAFATGGLKFNDTTRGFFEMTYTARGSSQRLAPEPLFTATEGVVVSRDSYYNPFGRDFRDVRRRFVEFGNRIFEQEINTFRLVTGVEGQISGADATFKNWSWDASFNLGRTQGISFKQGNLQLSKLADSIGPSFLDPATGAVRCGTPAAPIDGCVPLDLFGGENSITPQMRDYLTYRGTARGFSEQISIQANTRGELFRLPTSSRAIGLAVGYEHRREAGGNIPDPLTATGDTTGNKAQPTLGRYYVNEAYLELSVPLLSEITAEGGPGREIAELSAATRAFNYSNFGADFMYKVGGRVTPVKDITVRATYSTAFRAPSIAELYSGTADGFPLASDPCNAPALGQNREQGTPIDAECDRQGVPDNHFDDRAQLLTIGGGNSSLRPERASTLTAGLVFEPQFFKDLSATVDYYTIDVTQAVNSVGADVILSSCYPEDPNTRPEYCDRILRDGDGFIDRIFDPLSNVGGNRTSGLDIALRYFPTTPVGRIGASVTLTRLFNFDQELSGGRVVRGLNTYDLNGVYTDWRALANLSWANQGFNANLNVRWINGFRECQANDCSVPEDGPAPLYRDVDSWYAADINAGYSMKTDFGESNFQIGVNNVLDRAPVFIANGFTANSDPGNYDFMGRYFFARVTHRFY
jgi:iron complex outermembrane recepter protein